MNQDFVVIGPKSGKIVSIAPIMTLPVSRALVEQRCRGRIARKMWKVAHFFRPLNRDPCTNACDISYL